MPLYHKKKKKKSGIELNYDVVMDVNDDTGILVLKVGLFRGNLRILFDFRHFGGSSVNQSESGLQH
jgi:hypothetical protein